VSGIGPAGQFAAGACREERVETATGFERRTLAKVSWRLLPLIVVSYLVAYVDRTNVAFASLTMNRDVGLSPFVYGLGAGIFFIGYALFEVPSNLVLERVGARRWIARIMLTWGVISALMALTAGPASFLTLRFLLGVAEAGFFPGMIFYLSGWYPARYRARVISTLFVAVPMGNAIAAAVSGAIMEMDGILGLRGWRWVFVLESVPAIALAFVVLRMMTDRPRDARWLEPAQREWLEKELQAERTLIERGGHVSPLRALADGRVLALAAIYFFSVTAGYGMTFFLPQIVKQLGGSNFTTGLLTAIPYTLGIGGLLLWGWSSDRLHERRWHLIAALTVSAAGFVGIAVLHGSYWAIAAMAVVAVGGYGSRPAFWPMPSMFLTGAAAASGIALINSLGNLGGYVGPFIVGWIKDATGSFQAALYFLAACAALSALITFFAGRATQTPNPHGAAGQTGGKAP
jgi:ACS family tartrate transporter-like MFS transporter